MVHAKRPNDYRERREKSVYNNDTALGAKRELREWLIEGMPGNRPLAVLDAFCGPGAMYSACYEGLAKLYVGVDKEWFRDGRLCYVGDNRRIVRALDLSRFNLFDLDAHASPWDMAWLIAKLRPLAAGEVIGFAMTDASKRTFNRATMSRTLADLAGLSRVPPALFLERTLHAAILGLADRMGGTVIAAKQAKGRTASEVRYLAVLIRGHAQTRKSR